jgi:Probable sensor domain DACNV
MSAPLYPAAREFAPRLAEHFSRHAEARPKGAPPAPSLPDGAAIEAMIDAGFWASLQREEGHETEISLAFLPPERAVQPLLFARPLALGPRVLARLAPAVERPGIHLGVWPQGGEQRIWGTTRAIPTLCFVLEVLGPGLLVVKHRFREESAKFRNVAVFEGEEVKLLRQDSAGSGDFPVLFNVLFGGEAGGDDDSVDVLLRLAVSMRAHRRGGTLLVVPADEGWRSSIVHPITYAVEPPFTELAHVLGDHTDTGRAALGRVVAAVAGLTAVDGATLMTDRHALLAFGAKIARPEGRPRVEQVVLTEPVEGGAPAVVPLVQLGGTRHISAAQFAQDQQEAIAMVASQDGHFTVFAWCSSDSMVHAHRVESLLL